MLEFSDYIVYVDESGDHSLKSIDKDFPVFALSFCVVKKTDYVATVVPSMQKLKFKYWGHDSVVLHEREIRKSKGDFSFLLSDRTKRNQFYEDLNQVMSDAPIKVIASVINKQTLKNQYSKPLSPYDLALQFCLEKLYVFLNQNDQHGKSTYVVFEARGNVEDNDLEKSFNSIVGSENLLGQHRHKFETMSFKPRFAKKSVNSAGLQLADLTARTIAIKTLRPKQNNRAYDIIAGKLEIKKFPMQKT